MFKAILIYPANTNGNVRKDMTGNFNRQEWGYIGRYGPSPNLKYPNMDQYRTLKS